MPNQDEPMFVPMQIVPLEVKDTTARIWVGGFGPMQPASDLELSWYLGATQKGSTSLGGNWILASGGASYEFQPRCQRIDISGLLPNKSYNVYLKSPSGANHAWAEFETLPTRLPRHDATRGFTVMLASCYDSRHDNPPVAEKYKKLYAQGANRPHIKFLVGDQVYLDLPAQTYAMPAGSPNAGDRLTFRTRNSSLYHQAWRRLNSLLLRGSNYFSSDDHEFFNNYPEPSPNLVAFANTAYRNAFASSAKTLYRNVQTDKVINDFKIGNDLSFFVADTRINRTNSRFMSPADFAKLEHWLGTLNTPGVLVLGQPIFEYPGHTFEKMLPDYTNQFKKLEKALITSAHDIIVLTGDKHFGRIASVNKVDVAATSGKIWEIISSPLSLSAHPIDVNATQSHWSLGVDNNPARFPILPRAYSLGSNIQYHRSVRAKSDNTNRTEEHFMTVEFRQAAGGGVKMTVKAWLPRLTAESASNLIQDFSFTATLK